ncbi:MAG: hypothetical protein NTY35_17620 [Planctomycetota bacterium]|nr:hypothetical protein [Planctomycetota bacterium]
MAIQPIASGLLLVLAGASALGDSTPRYAVAPETALKHVYTSSTKLESEPAQMFLDGKEIPKEGHGELRLRVDDSRSISFTDTVAAVADGRPTRFSREFGELENSATESVVAIPPEGEEEVKASTRERASALSGKTVRFTWDGAKEEYARAFEEKGPDEDLLAGLQADAQWLPLLEDGPREKGAAFDLEPALFERVQYPAGELHWKVEGKENDPVSKAITEQLSENLDGKAKATWLGAREVDGRELGVFAVEAQLKSNAEAEAGEGGETRKVELELEYEGEILWDLAGAHLAGYTLTADVRSVLSTTRTVESPKGSVEVRQVFDLRGKAAHRLTVTKE